MVPTSHVNKRSNLVIYRINIFRCHRQNQQKNAGEKTAPHHKMCAAAQKVVLQMFFARF